MHLAPAARSGVVDLPPRLTAYPCRADLLRRAERIDSRTPRFLPKAQATRVTDWTARARDNARPAAAEWGTRGPRGVAGVRGTAPSNAIPARPCVTDAATPPLGRLARKT